MIYSFGKKIRVEFDSDNFAFCVRVADKVFSTVEGAEPFVHFKDGRKMYFKEAGNITVKPYPTGVGEGILVELSEFPEDALSFALYLWVENTNGSLHAEWIPYEESQSVIYEISWPQPLHSFAEDGYSVLNLMNGKLIPDMSDDVFSPDEECRFFRREGYMPFFGQVGEGGSGYVAIVETPWDGANYYEHSPKSPTIIRLRWFPTLDKMSYRRSMFYVFYDRDADYVKMCKEYRRFAKEHGRVVSLKEKVDKNPLVARMIGGAVVHTPMIARNVTPQSDYYNKEDESKNHALITFREMTERLERLYSLGVRDAYVHVDGWGRRGYDNGHPDILPPCPEAGGWEGMEYMVSRLREIGYIPAIHDNYRDYYLNADTYNDNQAQVFVDGTYTGDSIWYGGPQRKLCSALAMNYVRRNFDELYAHGCLPDGAYLDVFSIGELDECANPMHRASRRECLHNRRECFEYVRSRGMIVSSEETIDEFVDSLDLVHYAPWYWYNTGGVNVPLMELVYHDAILIPAFLERGASYAPKDEYGVLHALLQGDIPYISLNADEKEIETANIVRRLHKEVAFSELLSHKFLSDDYKIQESRFASGVVVRVNFKTDEYRILWADGSVTEGRIDYK